MGKPYYKAVYAIFFSVLAAGGALRLILKLSFIDPRTGFYEGAPGLSAAFTALFILGALGLAALNLFYRGSGDYQLGSQNRALPFLALLAGLGILCYNFFGYPVPLGQATPEAATSWDTPVRVAVTVLGALAGLSFLVAGLYALLSRKPPPALLAVVPSVWQVTLLLVRFNGYYAVLHISDFFLAISFSFFASLFFLGHARTVCGLGRRDGRNYVIFTGLCTALSGLFLTVPNYVYMLVKDAPMPVPLFSLAESAYVLSLSVYALVFVVNYTRSMAQV